MSTIFSKIIEGVIPSEKVYEDDLLIVIKDIHPVAPVHLLIIPKKAYASVNEVPESELSIIAHIVKVAQKMADAYDLEEGYRLVTNAGPMAGQTIFHMHFHLIGGRQLSFLA